MAFVQLIEYETSQPDEVKRTFDEWQQAAQDMRKAKRVVLTRHRDQENRFVTIVFFDSYEEAMENSNLEETQQYSRKVNDLIDGEPTYFDLDVIEDWTL